MGTISGFAGDNKTQEEGKISRLLREFWNLEKGQWGRLDHIFKEIGDPLVEPLISKLRHPGTANLPRRKIEWIQRRIARSLGNIGTEKAAAKLMEMLPDKTLHDYCRYEAARALARMKALEAIELLTDVLNDRASPAPVRSAAAHALGEMKAEEAVPSLLLALSENNNKIRWGAISALGKIGTERTVGGLLNALNDPDGYSRQLAYQHLFKLRPGEKFRFLTMAFTDEDWAISKDAAKALVEMGRPAVEYLIAKLRDKRSIIRLRAAVALKAIKPGNAAEALVQALKDEDWLVRNAAAAALIEIDSRKSLPLLIKVLHAGKAGGGEEAAWILGELKIEPAVKPLIRALKEKNTGWMAAAALGKIGSKEAVKPLLRRLKDKDIKIRRAAAWALAKLPVGRKAVNALKKALKDEDGEVRVWAAVALKKR